MARKQAAPQQDGFATYNFHKRTFGADFPYFDFAPMFQAELYNPDHWADLFVKSGARYVALTSKHHEGFTLWRNEQANRAYGRLWNSVEIGPKRDLLIDLMQAGRNKGLNMGIYYSLYEWYNPLVALGQKALRERSLVSAIQRRGHARQAGHHLLRRRVGDI